MTQKPQDPQIYAAFLKAIRSVGMTQFKQTSLFGRNDEEEVKLDEAA